MAGAGVVMFMSGGSVGKEGKALGAKSSSAILAILCHGRRDIVDLSTPSSKTFVIVVGKMKGHRPPSYSISFS